LLSSVVLRVAYFRRQGTSSRASPMRSSSGLPSKALSMSAKYPRSSASRVVSFTNASSVDLANPMVEAVVSCERPITWMHAHDGFGSVVELDSPPSDEHPTKRPVAITSGATVSRPGGVLEL